MTTCIYMITNLQNTKIYIGSAVNFNYRKRTHLSLLRNNKHHSKHLQSSWNKYGEENFFFEIIEKCDKNKLLEREQFYLNILSCDYNIQITAGSNLGLKFSDNHKAKLRKAHETRTIYSKGHTPSLEARLAVVKANIARKGMKYKKLNRVWNCPDGQKCKCDDCRKRKNYLSMVSKRKRRNVYKVIGV